MLPGNELNEIIMNPIVYDEHSYEENELENTDVFSACAVTTAMRMKPGEDETLLQDGSTETRDVELKHILFAYVNDHLLYYDGDISLYLTDTDRNPWNLLTKWKNERLTR